MSEFTEPMGEIQKLTADRDALLETIQRLTNPATPLAREEAAAQIARAKDEVKQLQVDIDKFHAG